MVEVDGLRRRRYIDCRRKGLTVPGENAHDVTGLPEYPLIIEEGTGFRVLVDYEVILVTGLRNGHHRFLLRAGEENGHGKERQ